MPEKKLKFRQQIPFLLWRLDIFIIFLYVLLGRSMGLWSLFLCSKANWTEFWWNAFMGHESTTTGVSTDHRTTRCPICFADSMRTRKDTARRCLWAVQCWLNQRGKKMILLSSHLYGEPRWSRTEIHVCIYEVIEKKKIKSKNCEARNFALFLPDPL